MSVRDIIRRRRDALVAAWIRDPLIQVQVETPFALPRLAFIEDGASPASPGALGRRNPTKVALVENLANPDLNASVWLAADYGDYKGAYLSFLRRAYKVEAKRLDLAGFDVDHLLNRARSPKDSTFIRIEAVPSAVNQDWGRLFERAASNPDFYANANRERRTMSYVICAELAGQAPPLGPGDAAGVARLASYFASVGIDRNEALNGLNSMLAFAYKLRA